MSRGREYAACDVPDHEIDLNKISWTPGLVDEIIDLYRVITTRGAAERSAHFEHIVNFSAYAREGWIAEKAAALRCGSKVLDVGAGRMPRSR